MAETRDVSDFSEAPESGEERGSTRFSLDDGRKILDRIFAVSQADAVWGQPIEKDGYTVMTASEVAAGGGFGFGSGRSPSTLDQTDPTSGESVGGGAGGGGGARARPVAVVLVGPDGVQVKPIVDVTKVALAAMFTWGVAIPILLRLRRGR